ncbi:MAG: hypothetical protein Alpg2KO_13590 [Alphaproteobacteria bacterium]
MSEHLTPIALVYDFDGTLSPTNMQEYAFIPAVQSNPDEFWEKAGAIASKHGADSILAYMWLMIKEAAYHEIAIRRDDFATHGETVELFPGVPQFFGRVNAIGRDLGLSVHHFIISSGIQEMIEGTPIAHEFDEIYASSFMYDASGVAFWPSQAINYTTKTQFLFRINKGVEEVTDHKRVNDYVPDAERPFPFHRMLFLGDGFTDVPCMKLIKDKGGTSIVVWDPDRKGSEAGAKMLLDQGRVNHMATADYRSGSTLDQMVTNVLHRYAAEARLANMQGDLELG